jgi:hypothetical protein
VVPLIAYWNIPVRIYGFVGENLLYPAVPMLLFSDRGLVVPLHCLRDTDANRIILN